MTTGSSNANMIAMMTARNLADMSIKQRGLFGQQKLFALVGADAHYSMDRAANILGMGADQLIKVELDRCGAMIPAELERAMDGIVAGGGRPFFVVATAGTTVRGGFDSITELLCPAAEIRFLAPCGRGLGRGGGLQPEAARTRICRGSKRPIPLPSIFIRCSAPP